MRHRLSHRARNVLVLACIGFAGCGGSTTPSALRDPSTQGVEALRQAIQSALLSHDYRKQCELFAPVLVERYGGTIDKCANAIRAAESIDYIEYSPYDTSPSDYTAGGTIEMAGNVAVYSSGETVFRAVYSESTWKVAAK
jgi:hypothetical protein